MRDPRSHRRYVNTRRAWLAGYSGPAPCALCGHLVDVRLPGTHRYGPTVEHRYPIRAILAQASSDAEALALACDTSLWSLAHRICQDRQGQRVTSERRKKHRQKPESPQSSRQW